MYVRDEHSRPRNGVRLIFRSNFGHSNQSFGCEAHVCVVASQVYFLFCYFWDFRQKNAVFRAFFWRSFRFPQLIRHQKIPPNKKPWYFWVNSNHGNAQNQGLGLGGSTASNQDNLRPRARGRSSVLFNAQNLIETFFVVVLQKSAANAISGSWNKYDFH